MAKGLWTVVRPNNVFRGEKCALCGRTARPGQAVYLLSPPEGRIVQHKGCLEGILGEDNVPSSTTEVEFDKVRDAIVATGDIFVEV